MQQIVLPRLSLLYISASSVGFVVFGFYLLHTDDNLFRVVMAFFSPFFIFAPRVLCRYVLQMQFISQRMLAVLEMLIAFMLSLNGIGALGLYLETQYYDLFLHFLNPFLIAGIISILIGSYGRYSASYQLSRVQHFFIFFTMILLIGWEIWEYAGDQLFGTQMFGQPGEEYDTITDLGAGMLSMSVVYYINNKYLNRLLLWAYR